MFKKCLEIGCHYRNTILEYKSCVKSDIFVVDPIREFLDKIPDSNNITKLNYAVTDNLSGHNDFFYINTETAEHNDLPDWATTMGSLMPTHATVEHFNWDSHRSKITVECITLEKLCQVYNLHDIDYLQVDTEGYDYKILVAAHEMNLFPNIIKFESKLLTQTELDILVLLYSAQGYKIVPGKDKDFNGVNYNTIFYKNDLPEEILS